MKKRIAFTFLLVLLCLFMTVSCELDEKASDGGASSAGGTSNGTSDGGDADDTSADTSLPCEHSFSDWRTTKEATCKEEGIRGRSCRLCSETEITAIPKTDTHTPKADASGVERCTLCGTVLSDNSYYTLTFKINGAVASTQRLKAGEEIKSEPTPEGGLWYNWDQKIPERMPSKDLTVTAKSIGGNTSYIDVYWSYDFHGALSIHGYGSMPNYSTDDQPWAAYKDEITALSIESGVTSIGKYTFFDCAHLKAVVIPDTVKTIGEYAFACCDSIREITFGAKLTSIGKAAFVSSYDLERVTFRGSLVWTARINNYYTDVTFSGNDPYKNATYFEQYYEGSFTAK